MERRLADLEQELAELRTDLRSAREEVAWLHGEQALTGRRLRSASGIGLLLVVVTLAAAIARPGETRSGRRGTRVSAPFTVVDPRGKPILQVTAQGSNRSCTLTDANGKTIVFMGDNPVGRGLDVFDSQGVIVVGTGIYRDERGEFRGADYFDAGGKNSITVGTRPDGRGEGLHVVNPGGALVGDLVVEPNGAGSLSLRDAAGNSTSRLP